MTDTVTDEVLHPAYVLVDYAWAVLHANMPTVWDKSKYGGMVPIVPLSEEPDLDEFSGPHIVYGYADEGTGPLPARQGGSTTFAIYDDNFRRLTRTLNCLKEAFNREDESARDVNRFSTYFLGQNGNPGPYLGIRFGHIGVAFTEGGTPEDSEGGRQSAIITIRYEYYVTTDVITNV